MRWYGLDYQFAIGAERLGRQSFLAAVTVYDDADRALARWDGDPASSTFLYHENDPAQGRFGFSDTIQNAPNALERLRSWRLDPHTEKDIHTWRDIFDVNGDGIPDRIDSYILEEDCVPGPGAWTVHLGSAQGFAAASVPWTVPDKSVLCYIRSEHTPGDVRWTERDTVDLTGDGIPDYVDTTPGDTGIWNVYPGYATSSGGGFRDPPIEWPAPGANLRGSRTDTQWPDLGFGGSVTIDTRDLIDLDGDGLLDLVQAADGDSSLPWSFWINTGQGFDAVARQFPAPYGVLGFRKESDEIVALRDMNGDGLPDLVVAWDRLSHPGTPDFWEVYLHNGLGIDSTPEMWPVPRDRYDSSRTIGGRLESGLLVVLAGLPGDDGHERRRPARSGRRRRLDGDEPVLAGRPQSRRRLLAGRPDLERTPPRPWHERRPPTPHPRGRVVRRQRRHVRRRRRWFARLRIGLLLPLPERPHLAQHGRCLVSEHRWPPL